MNKLKYYYRIFCLAANFYKISKREDAGWTPLDCWRYSKIWIDGDFSTSWVEKRIRGEDV